MESSRLLGAALQAAQIRGDLSSAAFTRRRLPRARTIHDS
jgi:hypothetical protein